MTSTLTILSCFHMGLFMSLYFFWHSIIISQRFLCFQLLNAAPAGASLSVSTCMLHQWWFWDDPPLARLIDYVLTGIVLCECRFIADMNSATNTLIFLIHSGLDPYMESISYLSYFQNMVPQCPFGWACLSHLIPWLETFLWGPSVCWDVLRFLYHAYHTRTDPHFSLLEPSMSSWHHYDITYLWHHSYITMTSFSTYDLIPLHFTPLRRHRQNTINTRRYRSLNLTCSYLVTW